MLIGAALALAAPLSAQGPGFADFSKTDGITLTGDAGAATDGSRRPVLRLTPARPWMSGAAFATRPVMLGRDMSFSTRFTMNINAPGGAGDGADGIVFVVQTQSDRVGGTGGLIGYGGIARSVGVEFDSYDNGQVDANSDNHVGINLGGDIASVVLDADLPLRLRDGKDITAWVDYDGASRELEVRIAEDGRRPEKPLLAHQVDLVAALGSPRAFVGFTSGTGAGWANHDIVSWTFVDHYAPIDARPPLLGGRLWWLAGAGLALLILFLLLARRRRRARKG